MAHEFYWRKEGRVPLSVGKTADLSKVSGTELRKAMFTVGAQVTVEIVSAYLISRLVKSDTAFPVFNRF